MYSISRVTCWLLAACIVGACATSPSQDSDFVVYGEEPEGPGVISGEAGNFVLFETDDNSTTGTDELTGPGVELSVQDWEEFEAFKRWLKARQTQNELYQEFLHWRQFEAYRKWQDTQ